MQVRPVVGETDCNKVTVPVKLLREVTAIVDVPGAPTAALTLVGLAVIEKSGAGTIVKATVAE